jgi:transcriptional regulator with XRE-family HTH domain
MNFSKKLQMLRKQKGYSQEYLAEQCGVSRQAVSKWESGNALPETDKLLYISQLFDTSIDYLIKDDIEDRNFNSISNEPLKEKDSIDYSDFLGKWCDIKLGGWDEGYITNPVGLVADNNTYIIFTEKGKKGVARKEFIKTISLVEVSHRKLKKLTEIQTEILEKNQNPYIPFLGKKCNIQIHSGNLKELILETDSYYKAEVISADDLTMKIKEDKRETILNLVDISVIIES